MSTDLYSNQGLLRFTTAGSVDDGKSTLIGRLLYDSKSIFEDQMDQLEESSRRRGKDEVDLSLLTDGLRAEREQGITIDVAYRYFATPHRKFIIADTPGHIQYTRNMVTGASTANLALILVDSRNGVVEQTIRHTFIANLLNIKHIVFCINKMDLVDFDEEVYIKTCFRLQEISAQIGVEDPQYLPISAKLGDNVVDRSQNMSWYHGPTLMQLLETIEISKDWMNTHNRFPVQTIIRPMSDEFHDFRGYAGRVAGGKFCSGDDITVLPSGIQSKIKAIHLYKEQIPEASYNDSVVMELEDDIDISRGDMIVNGKNPPQVSQELRLTLCWFNERPLAVRGKYVLRHTSAETRCIVQSIDQKININTLEKDSVDKHVGMNDIAEVSLKTVKPVFFDSYHENRITGSVILIDEATNETVAAGMIQ